MRHSAHRCFLSLPYTHIRIIRIIRIIGVIGVIRIHQHPQASPIKTNRKPRLKRRSFCSEVPSGIEPL